jgi:Coenzyme PQQ synthesis protein D (PqqD)
MTELRLNSEAVSWREVDSEVIALDHESSSYLATNATGALLWKSLAQGTSREALVALLVADYDVEERHARADVDAFLECLAAQGLLAA